MKTSLISIFERCNHNQTDCKRTRLALQVTHGTHALFSWPHFLFIHILKSSFSSTFLTTHPIYTDMSPIFTWSIWWLLFLSLGGSSQLWFHICNYLEAFNKYSSGCFVAGAFLGGIAILPYWPICNL